LSIFSDVEPSSNYDADFSRIVLDRNTKAYSNALNWARIFLQRKSFTSFSGSTVSMALLFPMEKLFECYIATLLRRELTPKGYTVSTQDRGYYLFDSPKKFSLRPDIVVKDKKENIYILDTKWKVLNSNFSANYGISQSDMYQMYAYHKKYETNSCSVSGVIVIYPQILGDFEITPFSSNDNVKVNIHFFDMSTIENSENSIEKIEKIMEKS
jgi:5-methylcytosine-specific restriction enzyme subunit McrC